MRHFQFYGPVQLQHWTRQRRYETKLGEKLRTLGAPMPQPVTVGTSFSGEFLRAEASSHANAGAAGTNGSAHGVNGGSMSGTTVGTTKVPSWKDMLKTDPATYVIVGIPEDIGVKANGGMGGAGSAWNDFMTAFLNIQSTDMFSGGGSVIVGRL